MAEGFGISSTVAECVLASSPRERRPAVTPLVPPSKPCLHPEGKEPAAVAADQVDSILLVTAWFRKHTEERQRMLTPEDALALCSAGAALARR